MNLPDLCAFHGNWQQYVEDLYQIYLDEIAHSGLTFEGLPVRNQFRPYTDGKGYGFWHIISDGPVEDERIPDMRRCERIKWVPWIIQNVGTDQRITWWKNKRGSNKHVVLWIEEEEFAVILAKRSRYYLLRTAYMVRPNRRRIFIMEREEFWKAQNG